MAWSLLSGRSEYADGPPSRIKCWVAVLGLCLWIGVVGSRPSLTPANLESWSQLRQAVEGVVELAGASVDKWPERVLSRQAVSDLSRGSSVDDNHGVTVMAVAAQTRTGGSQSTV